MLIESLLFFPALVFGAADKTDIAAYTAFAVQIAQQLPQLPHPHLQHFHHRQEPVCLEASLLGPLAPQGVVAVALRQLLGPARQHQLQHPRLAQLHLTGKGLVPGQLQQPQL